MTMLVLSGCGFQPLYAKKGAGAPPAALAAVEVARIKDRTGHVLRNHLIASFGGGGGQGVPTRYTLAVNVEAGTAPVLIQIDDKTTRFNLSLTGQFTLTDRSNGAVVYSDTAKAVGSYNVVDSEFATLVAEDDARKEAARVLGDEIRALLIVFFSRQATAG